MPRFLLVPLILLAACAPKSTPPPGSDFPWLTSTQWNDGQAEVAFYRLMRPVADSSETLLVGTYLVKQDYDPDRQAKATAQSTERVSAFKSALFYEFERDSYQFKYHWVANAAQADLAPLKASFTSFDWCSNAYRELLFGSDGTVRHLYRSDDYGNLEENWRPGSTVYPMQMMPLLIRALSFGPADSVSFRVLSADGAAVLVTAVPAGLENREGRSAQRIELSYSAPVPSMYAIGESAVAETWWRSADDERLLLGVEASDGRYRLDLVESVRSAYWQENLFPGLLRVDRRP